MKKLCELVRCESSVEISGISTDSRTVKEGYLFVATKGYNVDHFDYILDAISNGAVAVVADRPCDCEVPVVVVSDIDSELITICEKFFEVCSDDFSFIGITGTDGKTTTATITKSLLNHFVPTAYIGTNGVFYGDEILTSNNTTPCIEELYYYFSLIKKHGCQVIVMEVSSESLLHKRVNSIKFDIVAYTNITEDHLNVHKSIENYRNCKFQLAQLRSFGAPVIINGDDENCKLLNVNKMITFGFSSDNQYVIVGVNECKNNVDFSVKCQGKSIPISSPFLGKYNVYNVTLAWLISLQLGYDAIELASLIPTLSSVNGRREKFSTSQGFDIILDYGHTENGILNILSSLKSYTRVIVVTGAAGGREQEKRSRIGTLLAQYTDFVIFTMDDPRFESVDDIIDDMLLGYSSNSYERIINREEAILRAFQVAEENDVVVVLGKGRDTYMAIGNDRVPYSDYEVICSYLEKNS